MYKLSILFTLLFSYMGIAQTIKVTVTETQELYKFGYEDPQSVINNPDSDKGIKKVDCDYIFDLNEMTSTFYSRSAGGFKNTLTIDKVIKKGNKYILEIGDTGLYDNSYSYHVKIYLDTKEKTMLYTWYDPYLNRSFVMPEHKLTMVIKEIL